MEYTKVQTGIRKAKKKQVKDELDRIKQAEKKKRRLEKALATSAAIRSELEKKKMKKKEEQQRLDEEGAAIAEAVALHVLLGEESEDPHQVMLKKDEGFTLWDHGSNFDLIPPHQVMLKKDEGFTSWDHGSNFDLITGGRRGLVPDHKLTQYSLERIGWFSDAHRHGYSWSHQGNSDWIVSSDPWGRDFRGQYFEQEGWDAAGLSPGLLATKAVSSLQIAEDSQTGKYVFNRMLNG